MALMYDKVTEKCGDVLVPIMITCDPARDSPAVLKEYLKEFHPQIIGLTGEYENIKQTCKVYRVYFSTPSSVKPGQDYLVDHSIYFYLMGKCLPNPFISVILESIALCSILSLGWKRCCDVAICNARIAATNKWLLTSRQIQRAILSKQSVATSLPIRQPRSSLIISKIGKDR
jgi:hypothetical protein